MNDSEDELRHTGAKMLLLEMADRYVDGELCRKVSQRQTYNENRGEGTRVEHQKLALDAGSDDRFGWQEPLGAQWL